MADVALFHSVLGVRKGVTDLAAALRERGHSVLVADQYGGKVFEDYGEASEYAESVGFPALMRTAVEAVDDLEDGFIVVGFSNGAGMAEHVATRRRVSGAVLISGVLPLEILGAEAWPANVPVQIHSARRDSFRNDDWLLRFSDQVKAHAPLELVEYPIDGHLFNDPTLPGEYDPAASATLLERVAAFCDARTGATPS